MWTKQDIRNAALWGAGVASMGQPPEAQDAFWADTRLAGLWAKISGVVTGIKDSTGTLLTVPDLNAMPDNIAVLLADLLECDARKKYELPMIEPRHNAYTRVMAELVPDNRSLDADLNQDGSLDDGEAYLYDTSQYY